MALRSPLAWSSHDAAHPQPSSVALVAAPALGGAAGVSSLPVLLFAVSLAGGVLAVALLAIRRTRGTTMPYGPAIAAGLLLFSVLAT